MLVQVHDVTDGRDFLVQGEFSDSHECWKWAVEIKDEYQGRKLEVVQEGSPHFFVSHEPRKP